MKTEQVNKLYKQLSPIEQAALAFEAATREDFEEADLILESVERRNYQTPHRAYLSRCDAFFILALVYGQTYWQTTALAVIACHKRYGDDKTAADFYSKLASMNEALVHVCNEMKVDIAAVKKIAGCEYAPESFKDLASPGLVDEYAKEFKRVFTFLI